MKRILPAIKMVVLALLAASSVGCAATGSPFGSGNPLAQHAPQPRSVQTADAGNLMPAAPPPTPRGGHRAMLVSSQVPSRHSAASCSFG